MPCICHVYAISQTPHTNACLQRLSVTARLTTKQQCSHSQAKARCSGLRFHRCVSLAMGSLGWVHQRDMLIHSWFQYLWFFCFHLRWWLQDWEVDSVDMRTDHTAGPPPPTPPAGQRRKNSARASQHHQRVDSWCGFFLKRRLQTQERTCFLCFKRFLFLSLFQKCHCSTRDH